MNQPVWFLSLANAISLLAGCLLGVQFGLVGKPRQPANLLRIIGALLLVIGIFCITYARTTGTLKTGTIEKMSGKGEHRSQATVYRSNK